jgi:hypothetical protein
MTKPKASFLFALGRPGVIKGGKSIAGVPMAIAPLPCAGQNSCLITREETEDQYRGQGNMESNLAQRRDRHAVQEEVAET